MRILHAVSESPLDPRALEFVRTLGVGGEIVILSVQGEEKEASERAIEETRSALSEGPSIRILRRMGDPSTSILEEARRGSYDLLVVRAHDRHPAFLTRLVGDTTERILSRSPIPVLSLRSPLPRSRQEILSFSTTLDPPLARLSALLARKSSMRASLLWVLPHIEEEPLFSTFLEGPPEEWEVPPEASKMKSLLEEGGVEGDLIVRRGIPEEVLEVETKVRGSWIVALRAPPGGPLLDFLLGKELAVRVERGVRSSVLVVR